MKINLHIALLCAQFVMCIAARQPATAQTSITLSIEPRTALTTEQVVNKLVEKNLERARGIDRLPGTRVYQLEYHGFPGSRSAEMIVDVSYKTPETKEFTIRSEKGSRLLIEKVFHKLLQSEKEALTEENQAGVPLNNDNYRFALAGYAKMPTGPCFILSVEPLTKNKLLYRAELGSMQKTLLWCALKRRPPRTLPSGQRKPGLNRLTRR